MKKLLRRLEPERLGIAVAAWFRERIDAGPLFRLLDRKTVPTHRHSWIYVLGGAALFLFALQVASGSLLMLYYQPTEAAAHESVRKIATEVPCGWLVRSVHAWGADLFIAIVALHFAVKLFARAYRKPRELTWITGMLLLAVALAAGFSGYLLPWTELSYYATLVGTQIPGTVPVVGDWIVHFLRGGDQVTGDTITRFYAVHVMFLPLLTGAVILGHVVLIQVQGMSLPIGMPAERSPRSAAVFYRVPADGTVPLVAAVRHDRDVGQPAAGRNGRQSRSAESGPGRNQTRVVFPVHVSDAETRAGITRGVPVCGRRAVSPACCRWWTAKRAAARGALA